MSPVTETGLPAGRTASRRACCVIASDSQTGLALVHSLVADEFSEFVDVTSEWGWQQFVRRDDVAVLLLAFSDLGVARNFHQKYLDARRHLPETHTQVVMLCSRENVGAAYELCRTHHILDYVMFWPVTHDPKRLPLALHKACDAWEELNAAKAQSMAPPALVEDAALPAFDLQVLVVEDHAFQLAVALSVLISAGLKATGASSAQDALAMLENSEPGLILLDVDMPDMNGLEFLRLLKATPRFAHIPVIMLTVLRERELVLESLHEGAADFIAKPFDRDTMLQKIRRATLKG